ncbi:sigma-70 family RNA polymerase sigma factor [Demequina sp. NBRC 110051]|uniref:sigma-70 family RNA polymerase sigma factor n=1 Tax=Demequina sp. NBRC 110051 TaxID=1570340 RepID=UPI0009FC90BC|nr:sigma-70 family RNA polymerase sigma factor [Demequina sp. NBRC 110051]
MSRTPAPWARIVEALIRERGPALFGYAVALTGDRHAGEDLLQDALVRSFRRGRGDVSLNEAHAYVKRAMQTAAIDTSRRRKTRPATPTATLPDSPTPDHAGAIADRDALASALNTLSPRERTCIVMRYVDGLSAVAIAEETGLAAGTVRKYLSDAVAKLQDASLGLGLQTADAVAGGGHHLPVAVRTTQKGGQR